MDCQPLAEKKVKSTKRIVTEDVIYLQSLLRWSAQGLEKSLALYNG